MLIVCRNCGYEYDGTPEVRIGITAPNGKLFIARHSLESLFETLPVTLRVLNLNQCPACMSEKEFAEARQ